MVLSRFQKIAPAKNILGATRDRYYSKLNPNSTKKICRWRYKRCRCQSSGGGSTTAIKGVVLSAIGFTALRPAAGSTATSWMSGNVLSSNVGVLSESTYATFQSVAMGSATFVGMLMVIGVIKSGTALGNIL